MKSLALSNMRTVIVDPFRVATFGASANPSGIKSILFPVPGQMRSRKVFSRSNARSTGKYPSWKMGRMIHWESINELNAFRLLDCDPSVKSYCEQPCQIRYVLDGVERVHYPDILVTTTAGKQLWEVRVRSNASEPACSPPNTKTGCSYRRCDQRLDRPWGSGTRPVPRVGNCGHCR